MDHVKGQAHQEEDPIRQQSDVETTQAHWPEGMSIQPEGVFKAIPYPQG